MTDTPRTDELAEGCSLSDALDFCATLELELAATKEQWRMSSVCRELRAELDAAKRELDSWQKLATSAEILRKRAEHALASERALADRLAEQIEYIAKQELASEMDDHSSEHADWQEGYETCVKWSREALAAWKVARDEADH